MAGVIPADRQHLREWLARFACEAHDHFALEGCTGWRYVVEELLAAGITPHLAEPADTAALRGRKRHAKTDKTDARHLRVHLLAGDLPECWIPPGHVLEARAVVRLCRDLLDERGAWHQRIAADLVPPGRPGDRVDGHTGGPGRGGGGGPVPGRAAGGPGRAAPDRPAHRRAGRAAPPAGNAVPPTSPAAGHCGPPSSGSGRSPRKRIPAELGDVRRLGNSDAVVRHTGLDITVWSSDGKGPPGRLSRQGPQLVLALGAV